MEEESEIGVKKREPILILFTIGLYDHQKKVRKKRISENFKVEGKDFSGDGRFFIQLIS